jgi:hypothetical protein
METLLEMLEKELRNRIDAEQLVLQTVMNKVDKEMRLVQLKKQLVKKLADIVLADHSIDD